MRWVGFFVALVNLLTFALTVKGLAFKDRNEKPSRLVLLKTIFISLSLFQIAVLWNFVHDGESFPGHAVLGLAILLSSSTLFWMTWAANRQRPLSLAFQTDLPVHLNQKGPYRFIRHPFYTSYLLTFIGNACYTMNPWLLLVIAIEFWVYTSAATFEEKKFAQSSLKDDYENYKRRAGMFWPKINP
jgi:protein-S-isoprenylcysteine O-methyltransferase Ste14